MSISCAPVTDCLSIQLSINAMHNGANTGSEYRCWVTQIVCYGFSCQLKGSGGKMKNRYFSEQTFSFLASLAKNNSREWFDTHKQDYEDLVRSPALEFISAMGKEIPGISPHFRAVPKKVGGSLMRVYRDTRFSRDKTPYKTNIGIQFRHESGRDVHAPGYYVHISPQECFIGAGLWHPEADMLYRIRSGIVQHGDDWLKARDDKTFRRHFELVGDALSSAPRGFAKAHPLLGDLKRKDFIALASIRRSDVVSNGFGSLVVKRFKQAEPLMHFLCRVLGVRF